MRSLALVALVCCSGCWPFFFIEEPPGEPDAGAVMGVEGDGGVTTPDAGSGPLDKAACTWKGKKLYGKVQYVDSFPDVKIREVTSLPDLKVEKVDALATRCGQWEVVTSLPTLRVQVVSAFEDLEVEYVTAFPGFR